VGSNSKFAAGRSGVGGDAEDNSMKRRGRKILEMVDAGKLNSENGP
jgi:hypothetical protein